MYKVNDQTVFGDYYDENYQPTEEGPYFNSVHQYMYIQFIHTYIYHILDKSLEVLTSQQVSVQVFCSNIVSRQWPVTTGSREAWISPANALAVRSLTKAFAGLSEYHL